MTAGPEALAGRLAVLLAAIEDDVMRALAAEREVQAVDPGALAPALAELLHRTVQRDPRAGVGIAAIGRALAALPQVRSAIRAASAELPEVAAWLAQGSPLRSPAPEELHDAPGLEGVSLGHRKVLARRRDPDLLSRLARAGEPAVVRNLLENQRLTEPDVVRLAAQRPIRPATLEEIARSRRFAARPAVRRAIVRNPYAPLELALRLAPLLLGPELRDLAADAAVHPAVREEALQVLAARTDRHGAAAREQLATRAAQRDLLRERAREELAREELEAAPELLSLVAEFEAGVRLRRVDEDD